jgi:hypothetical protein
LAVEGTGRGAPGCGSEFPTISRAVRSFYHPSNERDCRCSSRMEERMEEKEGWAVRGDPAATSTQERREAERVEERERLRRGEEEKLARERDEKLLKELEGGVQSSVAKLFMVLCGTADGDDKFTG